jgi:hypothetical protein
MRIVITTDDAAERGVAERAAAGSDTRAQPDGWDMEAILGDAAASGLPVFRGFLESLRAEPSPFLIVSHKLWSADSNWEAEPIVFASRVDLTISNGAQTLDRHQYLDFAAGVAKLLDREPGDALRVELQIGSVLLPEARQELSLGVVLAARGTGRDQAQLRWSLGLTRVQQALLFEARALRQGRL